MFGRLAIVLLLQIKKKLQLSSFSAPQVLLKEKLWCAFSHLFIFWQLFLRKEFKF